MALPLNRNSFIDFYLSYYILVTEDRNFGLDIEALWHKYQDDWLIQGPIFDLIGWAQEYPEHFIEIDTD